MARQKIGVGDRFIDARRENGLGQPVTWEVSKIIKKPDLLEYAELLPDEKRLQSKMISLKALADSRMFVPAGNKS